jgi:L-lactate dehydrogenase
MKTGSVSKKHCNDSQRDGIFSLVKNAACEIIIKKGATYDAIALPLVRIAGSVMRDERSLLTVFTLVDGYYGLGDFCLSVPVILNCTGVSKILKLPLDGEEVIR